MNPIKEWEYELVTKSKKDMMPGFYLSATYLNNLQSFDSKRLPYDLNCSIFTLDVNCQKEYSR
jgi:hypothetical protein